MRGSTEPGRSGCFDVLSSCFKPPETQSSSPDMPNVRLAHIQRPEVKSDKPEVPLAPVNVQNTATSAISHSPIAPASSAKSNVSSVLDEFSSHNPQVFDLWGEAFESLDDEYKKLISASPTSTGDNPAQQLITLVQTREQTFKDNEAKIKIGDREVLWRDCATRVISLLSTTVDIGIMFAPAPGSAIWSGLKVLLNAHAGGCEALTAIFGCADKVLFLVKKGAIYEHVFLQTPSTSDDENESLRKALIDAYQKALELLCYASKQLKDGAAVHRFFEALMNPKMAEEKLKNLQDAEVSLEGLISAYDVEQRYTQNKENLRLLQQLNKPLRHIDHAVAKMLITLEDDKLSKTLDFISNIHVGNQHRSMISKKTNGTGAWLLKCEEFRQWEDSSSSKIFWLTGKVGAGKSVLTSEVVDRYQVYPYESDESESDIDEGFAFFYYSKNNKEVTDDPVTKVLRSFLRQLAQVPRSANGIFDDLAKLCGSMEKSQRAFTEGLCRERISALVNNLPRTTLVLDSLDEMQPQHMQEIISFFVELVDNSKRPVKIFISSRITTDIHNEVQKAIDQPIHVDIGQNNTRDIERFVSERTLKIDCYWRYDKVRNKVIQEISKKADGMFRWAFLQLDQLIECNSTEDVESRLGQLPQGLTAAYDELYTKPGSQDQIYLQQAIKWVFCAYAPFTTKKLLSAVQLRLEGENEEPVLGVKDRGLTEQMLESICRYLIVKDSKGNWAFPHASVQEYFIEKHPKLTDNDARIEVARLSLLLLSETYQCSEDIYSLVLGQECNENIEDDSSTISNPDAVDTLEQYISQSWILHVRAIQGLSDGSEQTSNLLKRFMISQDNPCRSTIEYQRWCKYVISLDRNYDYSHDDFEPSDLEPAENPAFGIATIGVTPDDKEWARACLELTLEDLNTNELNTLTLAAGNGQAELCVSLIEMGSDPKRILPSDTCALNEAIRMKRTATVKVLLEHGADPNPETNASPLCQAVVFGNPGIVQLLIAHGALINKVCSKCFYGCALEAAAHRNNQGAAEILIEAGATVDLRLPGLFITPLVAAASKGYLEFAKILIQHKADVNITEDLKDRYRFGGVLGAAFCGYWPGELVPYLITEAGVSPRRILEDLRGKDVRITRTKDDKIREIAVWLFTNEYLDPVEVQDLEIGITRAFKPLVETAKRFVNGELN